MQRYKQIKICIKFTTTGHNHKIGLISSEYKWTLRKQKKHTFLGSSLGEKNECVARNEWVKKVFFLFFGEGSFYEARILSENWLYLPMQHTHSADGIFLRCLLLVILKKQENIFCVCDGEVILVWKMRRLEEGY